MSVHKEFEAELKALLAKYKADISVREEYCTHSWNAVTAGVDVEFDGIYDENGNTIREFSTLELPRYIFRKTP